MGNRSKEFLNDSIQFESPICGRDTVKAILSLVPDNTDTLELDVYVKNPEGSASGY